MSSKDIFPRPLQYLIAIAEYGSFTRAAEALFVSQPTLSQQIKQLEESLQLPLLDRSGKSIRLTDAGETYIQHARRAWAELEAGTRAIHDVQNLTRGSLRLGWTPITDYMTCSLLESFSRHYPGISLSTLEMSADDIEVALAEDRIDYGIAFSKPGAKYQAKSADIRARTLFQDSLCLAVGNMHARAGQRKRIKVADLGKERMVMLNNDFTLRRNINQYFDAQSISPHIAIETDSLSVIIELIQAGSLATILPQSIVRTQCGMHSIAVSPGMPVQEITVICRDRGYKSPASVAFAILAENWSENRLKETPMRRMRPCPLSEPGCPLNDEYARLTEDDEQLSDITIN